jgi:hypothetical protein
VSFKFRTFGCSGDEDSGPHDFTMMVEDGELPRFCAVCGAEFEGEPEVIPGGGHIGGSAIQRTVDNMYREIERSSAERAELAGSPALKVTDMNDHLREGDVAAKMPNNTVTQFMAHAAGAGAHYGFGGGAMTGVAWGNPNPVPTNAVSGPGHEALWGIQGDQGSTNAQTRAVMTQAGQIKDTA